jgi:uncharacterized protein YlxP (DUF503 family)
MIIGVCTIELDIPAASLKDKRHIIKSVIARLRNKFNISVAEVDHLDSWQGASASLSSSWLPSRTRNSPR